MEEAGETDVRNRLAGKSTGRVFVEELKRICYLALPMMVVSVSQYLLRAASISIVGHLGKLELAGTSLAASLANVTGFSLLWGMSSALETLCGQAYGAGHYGKLGTYTLSGIVTLLVTCLPISLLWIFMDKLLILIGQDPLIAVEAREYAVWLIPSLFPYSILQPLTRYLMSQSLIIPMLLSSVIVLLFHVPTCWALVFWFDLGIAGAALAIGLSYTLNAILLGLYAYYSLACQKTRISFSSDVFSSIWEFLRFGIPSAVMLCLFWWSAEIVILLSGLLPNPQLETSVISIGLTISTLHFYIPYAFGVAASIRVSNELGAGNAEAAQMAIRTTMLPVVGEAVIAAIILLGCRSVLGYAFGNVKEVVDYVKELTPLICVTVFVQSLCALFTGVVKASGWQKIGAYINLGAYYLAGIPIALVLGFVVHLHGKGLWIGLLSGQSVQAVVLGLVICLTNWQKQASKTRERINAETVTDAVAVELNGGLK